MFRVGICDDGAAACAEIERVVKAYGRTHDWRIDTEIWSTGESLVDYLEDGNAPDLLFLDIDLITTSGVDIGQYIRRSLNNYSMKIVFISANASYALSLFDVQPMNFLVKPLVSSKIEECLDLAVRLLGNEEKIFQCTVAGETHFIPYRSILYFESIGRKIRLVTEKSLKNGAAEGKTDVYEYYGKIKEAAQEILSDESFLQVHRSYIVQIAYIQKYEYAQILMMDGAQIPVSQNFRKEVRSKMLERG